jgi:hypothetical protein
MSLKNKNMFGYHITDIKKGELGELSKIREELEEAIDAELQDCRIMLLIELSDMLGAIDAYLKKHIPGITLDDLRSMSNITCRAFRTGNRK